MKLKFSFSTLLIILFLCLEACQRSTELTPSITAESIKVEDAKSFYSKNNPTKFILIWEMAVNGKSLDDKEMLLVPIKDYIFDRLKIEGTVFLNPAVFVEFEKQKSGELTMKETVFAVSESEEVIISTKKFGSTKSFFESVKIFDKKGILQKEYDNSAVTNGRVSNGCTSLDIYSTNYYYSDKTGMSYQASVLYPNVQSTYVVASMEVCPRNWGTSPSCLCSQTYAGYGAGYANYLSYKFNTTIDYGNLRQSWKLIVDDIKKIQGGGSVGAIIRKFSLAGDPPSKSDGTVNGDSPGKTPIQWNWRINEGNTRANTTAYTEAVMSGEYINTFLSNQQLNDATDLSIARTIIHEGVHAYITTFFRLDMVNANTTFAELVESYDKSKKKDFGVEQHNEMTRNYVNDIANALKEFSQIRGHNINDDQFFKDLAWGGLESTRAFRNFSPSERERIHNVIEIELTGKDVYGNEATQRGRKP